MHERRPLQRARPRREGPGLGASPRHGAALPGGRAPGGSTTSRWSSSSGAPSATRSTTSASTRWRARRSRGSGRGSTTCCEQEVDAGLGNGGLGRLAACFLDSLATLHLPGFGYGLFYQYGLFRQEIDNGYQKERPDRWLHAAMPWTVERPEEAVLVPVYGRIVDTVDRKSQYNPMWMDWKILVGVPHEMPVVGFGGETVNALRLYSARASDDFDMEIFNSGDYVQAVQEAIGSETISKVLYPSDKVQKGKELRLLQEYFFVACALRDILRRFLREGNAIERFADKIAIQLNDTHPALAVAELMRLFVDEHDVAVGAGVGDDRRHARLHEPHPPPRGAREVAAPARGDGPPAPPPDHLRDQPALPRRGGPPRRPATRRSSRRVSIDRGGRAEAGPDGAARRRREPLDQRRRRAPLAASSPRTSSPTSTGSTRSGSTTRRTASRRAGGS